ncbi:MAG: GTPase ObgE [Clostridia bacterium]|nr:GTPase ObgE [Clostridia bacterium]
MFVDKAKIYIKAGEGGNGVVSFLRLKTIAKGGPDGGDGGKGGDIVFLADPEKNTLADFYYQPHYRAPNGMKGGPKRCNGKCGEDIIVHVPVGTVVKDAESGEVICDLFAEGERVTVLRGGRGGKGNARFCTPQRRSPSFCQTGEKTKEYTVLLELKTIADVGLCGFPNAGKSTLLSVMTNARPKIANYPFTTLSPNLGVVKSYEGSYVMADIPGLIEGAGEGAGLGHEFLRHVERNRMLLHVVDIAGVDGRDPVEDYRTINRELAVYSKTLSALPQIVVANKMDLGEAAEENLQRLQAEVGGRVYPISAATGEGIKELSDAVWQLLVTLPKPNRIASSVTLEDESAEDSFTVERMEDGAYLVSGGLIDRLAQNVILDDVDSFRYFQKRLRELDVIKRLREAGAKEGDTVVLLDFEFEFVE